MSYEPTILIRRSDLLKRQDVIASDSNKYEGDKAIQYIYNLIYADYAKFDELEIIVCKPELTSFNHDVRTALDDYDITYKTIL